MNKQQLRTHLRQRRQSLSQPAHQAASQAICSHILALPAFQSATRIGLYFPFPEEVDVRPLFEAIWSHTTQQLCLPMMHPNHRVLSFHHITQISDMATEQPCPSPHTTCPALALSDLDLLFMPLVGFNTQGHRLGMGGGYYDKTLASCDSPPACLGIGFSCQHVTELPMDPWDYPLSGIVTELGLIQPESTT